MSWANVMMYNASIETVEPFDPDKEKDKKNDEEIDVENWTKYL